MIKIYFETSVAAELVATFESEDTYIACLPALRKQCKKEGYVFVTEKVVSEFNVSSCCLNWSGLDFASYCDKVNEYYSNLEAKEFFDGEIQSFFDENQYKIISHINNMIENNIYENKVEIDKDISDIIKPKN